MKITALCLNDFLSHKETVMQFSGQNPILVVGENGVGKSTLVKDSVTWALFGKSRSGSDNLIREGQDMAQVLIEFSVGGKSYRVIRTRYRNSNSELNLQTGDGKELTGATIAETQQKIEKLLGLTYDMFVITSCIEQGKFDSFSKLTPTEAKSALIQILQLGIYDKFFRDAKAKADSIEQQLLKISDRREAIAEILSKNSDDSVMSKVNLDELNKEILLWRTELYTKESFCDSSKQIFTKLEKDKVRIEEQINQIVFEIDREERQYAVIESSNLCPTCGSQFHTEIKAQTLSHRAQETEIKRIEKCALIVERESIQSQLLNTDEHTRKFEVEIADINTKLSELGTRKTEIETRKAVGGEAKILAELEQKDLDQQSYEYQIDKRIYEVLKETFDKGGIPSRIIASTVAEIEVEANKILSLLSSGKMRVALVTQKTLKSSDRIAETLEIHVKYLTNKGLSGKLYYDRLYDLLSGGEKFRVDLALRIALSSILSRRNGYRCETLIIDEGLGSLDDIGKEKFIELTKLVSDQFKLVIIVTHTDVKERYDNVIEVVKRDGISEVKLLEAKI